MILAIDIGNSHVKLGLARSGRSDLTHVWRVATSRERTPDEWYGVLASIFAASNLDLGTVRTIAIASVVPTVTRWIAAVARDHLDIKPVILASDRFSGLVVATEHPGETGIDRVVNGFAAYSASGGPVIVVDAGTATKFDAVSADGRFLGGAIAPGIGLTLDALAGRAARLYAVELVAPTTAIGRNTVTALQSGVVLGYLDLCAGLIRRVKSELGANPRVIVTGGGGALLADHLPDIDEHRPRLTLEGIVLAVGREPID